MAVNKNFVVKNGLEVNESLILANASTKMVGIGTTGPSYLLDVAGGIGATDAYVTGFTTLTKGLQVGTSGSVFYVNDSNNAVGIGTSVPTFPLEVHSSVSAGTTALYVFGDAYLTGNLDVIGDIVYDEVTGRGINITGVSTFGTVQIASGIVTATSGVVTYYGDGSNLSGVATEFTSTIGVSSEGTFVGGGATIVNFASSNSTAWDVQTSGGIATATVTPGASIGLVIALGA